MCLKRLCHPIPPPLCSSFSRQMGFFQETFQGPGFFGDSELSYLNEPSFERIESCDSPLRVYMYDIPRKFNLGMIRKGGDEQRPWRDANVPSWPMKSGLKRQHNVEYWMMLSLLNHEAQKSLERAAVRVMDPLEADLYFMPFFSSLSFNVHGVNMLDPETEKDRLLQVKYDRHKPAGLLQPLPVPDQPWESIAMDFIMDLPRTQTGNDAISTIVDRFSKQAHFILVRKTIKADHMARVFLAQIFKHHGMPKSIVSDRDPCITGLFWRALFENLGTKLRFSSAYHPQTDGQSGIANSTILDLLKSYVSERQSDWEKYLPLVEYAYNNTVHSTTGLAPSEIIYGKPMLPPILMTKDKIFAADEFVRDLDTAYVQVKRAILHLKKSIRKPLTSTNVN
ncbi:hypothetical protein L7F22_059168 [Adiantum nelumboides]|nr:hypothetical protein [Adiantum nelumboides]